MDRPKYVTLVEVARRFGVTGQTVRNWVARPEIGLPAPVRIGNRSFFDSAKINAWEDQRIKEATEAA